MKKPQGEKHNEFEERVRKEIRDIKRAINAYRALMTTETTDGSDGETFMALPVSFTNKSIDILEGKIIEAIREAKEEGYKEGNLDGYREGWEARKKTHK